MSFDAPSSTQRSLSVRPLSPAQSATRRRLLDAAQSLATEGGYEAVGMREVAARAGVSSATAYTHFASRDHLLVELLSELAEATIKLIQTDLPRPQGAPVFRVGAALRWGVKSLEESPSLQVALMRAYLSGAAENAHARELLAAAISEWIKAALEGTETDDSDAVVETFGYICFGAMVAIATGHRTPREIAAIMERAAIALFGRDALSTSE